jgi:hypothetical protein
MNYKAKQKKEYFIVSSEEINWSDVETQNFDITDFDSELQYHVEIPLISGSSITSDNKNHKDIIKTKKLSDLVLLIESEGFYEDDFTESDDFVDYLHSWLDFYKICCYNKTTKKYSICKTENVINCYNQTEEELNSWNNNIISKPEISFDLDKIGFDESLYKSSFKNLESALNKSLGDKFNFGVVYCSNNLIFDVNKNNKGEISYGTFFTHHEKIKRDIALYLAQDIALGMTFKVYTKGKDVEDKKQFFEVYGFALINKPNVDYIFDIMNVTAEEVKDSYKTDINKQPEHFKNYVFSDLEGNRIII